MSVPLKPSAYGSCVVSSLLGLLPAFCADRNVEFHSLGPVESTRLKILKFKCVSFQGSVRERPLAGHWGGQVPSSGSLWVVERHRGPKNAWKGMGLPVRAMGRVRTCCSPARVPERVPLPSRLPGHRSQDTLVSATSGRVVSQSLLRSSPPAVTRGACPDRSTAQ